MKLSNVVSRKNRVLLSELVVTDFKLRYQGSLLGYLWSILNPLLLFTILYLVFDVFLGLGRGIEHYAVYLLVGIILWRFFAEATNNGLKVIVQRGALIRKINFPKYIIVFSGTISALINLGINFLIVFLFILLNGVVVSWSALWIIPLVLELYIFSLALVLSALNVKFRDIGYIWEVLLQAAFYATPIIYPLQLVLHKSELFAQMILFNPVAQIIQDARSVLVTDQSITTWSISPPQYIVIPFVVILVFAVIGVYVFSKKQARFAEDI